MATVLVIDDMPNSRKVVARLLQSDGHRTICCCNGLEALSAMGHVRPDVVLLDIIMPVMDGLTFLEIIRQNPQWEAMPVILMTGMADESLVRKARELGAKEYLVKASFSGREMLEQVQRSISRQ